MFGDQAIEVTGTEEVAAYLHRVGDSASLVDTALTDHGKAVVMEAQHIAPRNTGVLAAAITSTYSPSSGLVVTANAERVPYAYTFHAKELGTSNGYMVFRVRGHSRKGSFVTGYNTVRPIKSNPYLYTAWTRLESRLAAAVEAALTKVIQS